MFTLTQRLTHGVGPVTIWASLTEGARSGMSLIENRTLTSERYIGNILADGGLPFAWFFVQIIVLMQDNARPPAAKCVSYHLDAVGTQ